ncbi:MAG: hypothetical protein IJ242_07370 [Clostridia bacterium]|nr:hypothetical protein [Clostridia bacterium]
MNLVRELDGLSWRQFLVLCRNLSPEGAVAQRIRAMEDSPGAGALPGTDTEEAARAAEAFFTSVVSV